jgi:hypothetical protein
MTLTPLPHPILPAGCRIRTRDAVTVQVSDDQHESDRYLG